MEVLYRVPCVSGSNGMQSQCAGAAQAVEDMASEAVERKVRRTSVEALGGNGIGQDAKVGG